MSNAIIYSLIALIAQSIELRHETIFWTMWWVGLAFKFIEDRNKK